MKLVTQNYRSGDLKLVDVPVPALPSGGILVRNQASVVSVGTEKLIMELAQKSLLGKARARPDLVRQVINKARTDGIVETYRAVVGRLEQSLPLGYSSAGIVEEADDMSGRTVGDRVACFGSGFASHAEFVSMPGNLYVPVPDDVEPEHASFAGVGAIALHSVREAGAAPGDVVAVIGLGLLGQLAVQMLNASGCRVFGIDVIQERVDLALRSGAQGGTISGDTDLVAKVHSFSDGLGADSVLVLASSESSQPVETAAEIAADGGRLIVPGMVKLDLPRKHFYDKQLQLKVPRSAGPGIYDPEFELRGFDYPPGQVRWTAKRNLGQFLRMVSSGSIDLSGVITHTYPIYEAEDAYRLLSERSTEAIGVVLKYESQASPNRTIKLRESKGAPANASTVRVGMIGAGLWARTTLLPLLNKMNRVELRGLATATGGSALDSGKKYGFEYTGTDYREILSDDAIDAVVIATRHDLHAPTVIEAMRAGKHVFVEKPLAVNRVELDAIVEAAQGFAGTLMVGFNRRYSPLATRARELMSGKHPLLINCVINAGSVPEDSWVHDPVQGGGRLIGEMCHFVDLAQFISGSPPVKAVATGFAAGQNLPDNSAAILTMADGSIASINYSSTGDRAAARERVEVIGGGSVCVIDDFRSMQFTGNGKTRNSKKRFGVDRGHKAELEAFFGAIRGEDTSLASFAESVSAMLGTFAIVEAMSTGTQVDITVPISAGDTG